MTVPVPCPDYCYYLVASPTYLDAGPDRDNAQIVGTFWDLAEAEEERRYRLSSWNPDRGPCTHILEIAAARMM